MSDNEIKLENDKENIKENIKENVEINALKTLNDINLFAIYNNQVNNLELYKYIHSIEKEITNLKKELYHDKNIIKELTISNNILTEKLQRNYELIIELQDQNIYLFGYLHNLTKALDQIEKY